MYITTSTKCKVGNIALKKLIKFYMSHKSQLISRCYINTTFMYSTLFSYRVNGLLSHQCCSVTNLCKLSIFSVVNNFPYSRIILYIQYIKLPTNIHEIFDKSEIAQPLFIVLFVF